jgi:hypothetical protein
VKHFAALLWKQSPHKFHSVKSKTMKFSLALSALFAVQVAESSLLRADVDLNRELTYHDCVSVEEPILETDPLVNRIFDIQSG